MREGYYIIRTYEAGAVAEKTKFFVPGSRPTGKIRWKDYAQIRKAEQNEYAALKTLARLLNANFPRGTGLLLGLDYSPEGMEKLMELGKRKGLPVDSPDPEENMNALWDAASHALENCLRRVKRRLQAQGIELKGIYITADMDGSTGETVRVHHHLVVPKGVEQAFLEAWEKYGLGGVSWEPLHAHQKDRTPLAEYLLRQVRRIPDAKKYRSTRNLIRPRPKDRVAQSGAELRIPAGAELLFRQAYCPGGAQYVRYIF